MIMNGAQIVIDALKKEGVDTVFGYPAAKRCLFMTHCMTPA